MSAASLPVDTQEFSANVPDQRETFGDLVGRLVARLANDRVLPSPPKSIQFCGDGDFAAIGAEFVGHFITHGMLAPSERVLEIGCGIGRMAVPLTRYLQPPGSYDGVDIVASGIDWCRTTIAPRHDSFRFHHLDLKHALYNPGGSRATASTRLPFSDGSFDFICLVSVLTHLDRNDILNYAIEIERLLAPGGRCFVTAFMMNPPAREALKAGGGAIDFDPDLPGPVWHADPDAPLAAIAYDEDTLLELFWRVGLKRLRPPAYGRWSGRPSAVFQDICVLERERER